MDIDTSAVVQRESREHWNQMRRKAFWQRISSALGLSRGPTQLLAFDEVQEKLRLHQNAYRGLQQVPLDQIVGSVGRYHDFTRTFLPLVEQDGYRWRRVAELQSETGLPPIELYKVGEAYFVKDGNHRVSVARSFGMETIEAYVWEYQTRVGGLPPTAQVDDLIVKAEYQEFLNRTKLDQSRPDAPIILTEPGRYPELLVQIEMYRQNLERIDEEPRVLTDAATTWFDLVYSLAVEEIRESGVLNVFPDRTEADVFVWISKHRQELAERYGEQISVREAVERVTKEQQRANPVERVVQSAARSVADFFQVLSGEPVGERLAVPPDLPTIDEPLGRLLEQLSNTEQQMAYQGQRGDEWRGWRSSLRAKVWELLGIEHAPVDGLSVETIEQSLISGVERTKIRLQSVDGLLIPGYLLVPIDVKESLPGLLVYPGHGTIRQTAGLEHSIHHSNALALAQAGYVVLTLEGRGIGELNGVDHQALDTVARLMGRSWLGITLSDGLRGLDYLAALPQVDASRLGVTGLGLGGGHALYTAALDERVKAVVIANYLGGGIDLLATLGHGCDLIPQLWQYATISDVARLIVPRPVLYSYPADRFPTHQARRFFDGMRPSYEVFSCPDRTRFVEHGRGDQYDVQSAASWFHRWLVEEDDTSVLLWAPRE